MLPEILAVLRCPVCGTAFGTPFVCEGGHSFDRAKQGYVNLLAGKDPGTGDTADMVARRAAFLARGYYAPIAAALPAVDGLVLDAGAGTGYYLADVLDRSPGAHGLALDLSKFAVRRAAKAHPRMAAAVADCWAGLPVADESFDAVLNVFAPRNAAEFSRVLKLGGTLTVVTPLPEHLAGLREPLGMLGVQPAKSERTDGVLEKHFLLETETVVRATMDLDRAAAADLAGMGPSAWHTDPEARAAALPEQVSVDLALRVAVYGRTPG
ncbi:methyltransferase domain-containing protein [Longispora albida]|uniref:methyltransferase domain-containing protein n=1 Tax=Longispora albida TaxID=203523 RepID=UPI00037C7FCF|nr:methyltransferase domain-containing protein [Longispora albida]